MNYKKQTPAERRKVMQIEHIIESANKAFSKRMNNNPGILFPSHIDENDISGDVVYFSNRTDLLAIYNWVYCRFVEITPIREKKYCKEFNIEVD